MAGSHLKHQEFFEATGGIDETRLKRAQNSYVPKSGLGVGGIAESELIHV